MASSIQPKFDFICLWVGKSIHQAIQAVTKLDPRLVGSHFFEPLSSGQVNSPSQKWAQSRRIARGKRDFCFKLIALGMLHKKKKLKRQTGVFLNGWCFGDFDAFFRSLKFKALSPLPSKLSQKESCLPKAKKSTSNIPHPQRKKRTTSPSTCIITFTSKTSFTRFCIILLVLVCVSAVHGVSRPKEKKQQHPTS